MEQDPRESIAAARAALAAAKKAGIDEPGSVSKLVRKMSRVSGTYPEINLAVEVCCDSYNSVTKEHHEKRSSVEVITRVGRIAYCCVMPRLSDRNSIRDFIACVAHGMAMGIIPGADGTRLLYGAQIALAALASKKRHKKPTKSAQNTPGNQPLTPEPSTT